MFPQLALVPVEPLPAFGVPALRGERGRLATTEGGVVSESLCGCDLPLIARDLEPCDVEVRCLFCDWTSQDEEAA